jgi:thymidylate kinase
MKIAIIGTHFTGKTELAEALHKMLREEGRDSVIIKEVARHCPLPVNQQSTFESQAWILAEQVKREIESSNHEIVISDRSVIDNYAYSLRLFPEESKQMLDFVLEHSKTYGHIFKTTPLNVPIAADGFRDTNPVFREEIETIISNFLAENRIGYHTLPAENPLGYIRNVINNEAH